MRTGSWNGTEYPMQHCPKCNGTSMNLTQPTLLLAEAATCLTCGWVRYEEVQPSRLKATSPFAPMRAIAHYDGTQLEDSIQKELELIIEVIHLPRKKERFFITCPCPFCNSSMGAQCDPRFGRNKERTKLCCANKHIIYLWTDYDNYTWQ